MSTEGLKGLVFLGAVSAFLYAWPAAVVATRGVSVEARPPALPQRSVDTGLVAPSGATLPVRAGENLQHVLDIAKPGDVIALQKGAVFNGSFVLPAKPGAEWIVVRSDAADSELPPAGTRVLPSDAAVMAALESGSGAVITAGAGAHHYRFIGLEVRPTAGAFLKNVIDLGSEEQGPDAVPHHIIFDRCYIHGDAAKGSRRGVALNAAQSAVVDSYLADFKEVGADSQGIAGWSGPGPFKIVNNYIEGAGENVIFGGADPSTPSLVPSDIEFRRNHLVKPLAWKRDDPSYAGTPWTIKNLFELKNARRVLVDGNLLEQNWADAQTGYGILFTVRNQDGAAPWSSVEDVTFSNNLVRHSGSAINVLGHDDLHPSGPTQRVVIRNNLFYDIGGKTWGGAGTLLQILDGASDIAVSHNTALQTGNVITTEGRVQQSFVFTDNIVPHNLYGITGTGTPSGTVTLTRFFPGAIVRRNVIAGASSAQYPPDNFFPPSLDNVGFANRARDDYRLADASPYRRAATDGKDVGVDFGELLPAVEGASGTRTDTAPREPRHAPRRVAQVVASSGPAHAVSEMKLVFWGALGLLAYTFVGYPLLMAALVQGRRPRPGRLQIFRGGEPAVTIAVVAHDEAPRIRRRVDNLLSLDYPPDRLDVIVASDGSGDGTAEAARACTDPRLQVLAFATRRGKAAVLNDVVPRARGSIVVLADARQAFERGALRALVAPFVDPSVGAVSGELVLRPGQGTAVASGVGFYWRYEKWIRRAESAFDSTVGTTGAIYAIRRELFQPIPEDTLLDDVLIPLRIAAGGHRVLFEGHARAHDDASGRAGQELQRKVRTIAGTFQLFVRHPWTLHPLRNRLWFQTVSHKALRLLLPLGLVLVLVSSLALAHRPLYKAAVLAQLAFYSAAGVGFLFRHASWRPPLVSGPYVICLLAWATAVAFVRFATGRQAVTWERASAVRAHGPLDAVDGVPL